MKIKVDFDDSGFRKLEQNLKKVKGADVLTESLSSDFISKNTKFNNIDELIESSGFSKDDFPSVLNTPEWERFIADNTNYNSWGSLLGAATAEYLKKNLFNFK